MISRSRCRAPPGMPATRSWPPTRCSRSARPLSPCSRSSAGAPTPRTAPWSQIGDHGAGRRRACRLPAAGRRPGARALPGRCHPAADRQQAHRPHARRRGLRSEITVQGAAGHAGYPQLAADPVLALCQAVVTLQQIVSRRTDPTHGAVVSVGALEAGQAPNVIPAAAVARGTLRALDQADRAAMRTMLREIVQHVCLAHGCQGTVTIDEGEPALVNDESLAAASWPWLRQAGFTVDTSFRSCGSDDFAFYGATAPSLMMFIGAGSPVTLHHPRFLPDDDLVGQVASAMLAGYLGARGLLGGDRGQDELSPA